VKAFRSQIPAIGDKGNRKLRSARKVSTLEELEARNSFRIECYNLTVEKQRSISKLTYGGGDVRECGGPVEVVSRQQRHLGAFFISRIRCRRISPQRPTGPMKVAGTRSASMGRTRMGNAVDHNDPPYSGKAKIVRGPSCIIGLRRSCLAAAVSEHPGS